MSKARHANWPSVEELMVATEHEHSDGAHLLDELVAFVRRYVAFGADDQVVAVALWILQYRASGTTTDKVWARGLRQRNRITDQLLERAAESYLAGGAQQVADELHVSRRQADRYVKLAREKQLLT